MHVCGVPVSMLFVCDFFSPLHCRLRVYTFRDVVYGYLCLRPPVSSVCPLSRMEGQVKAFLDDPDSDITLDLGPDMRKIHYCFSLLKVRFSSSLVLR